MPKIVRSYAECKTRYVPYSTRKLKKHYDYENMLVDKRETGPIWFSDEEFKAFWDVFFDALKKRLRIALQKIYKKQDNMRVMIHGNLMDFWLIIDHPSWDQFIQYRITYRKNKIMCVANCEDEFQEWKRICKIVSVEMWKILLHEVTEHDVLKKTHSTIQNICFAMDDIHNTICRIYKNKKDNGDYDGESSDSSDKE